MTRVRLSCPVVAACLFFFFTGCATAPPVKTGKVDPQRLVDGIYEGSYRSGPVKALVKVTVEDQKISGIELIEHRTWKGKEAEAIIPDLIIQEQSTEVNAVSGATTSSRVIMNAVQNALDKAKKAVGPRQ